MSVAITQANFETEVKNKPGLVLVDFWAEWCTPCKVLGPIIEEVGAEVGAKAEVRKLNVDENQELAIAYGVMGIPTVILFKDGEVVEQIVGVRGKEEYLRIIDEYSTPS